MKTPTFALPSLIFLMVATALPANAYVDPGTGSFAIQALFAGAVGALFGFKSFWGQISGFGKKVLRPRDKKPE